MIAIMTLMNVVVSSLTTKEVADCFKTDETEVRLDIFVRLLVRLSSSGVEGGREWHHLSQLRGN